MIKSHKLSNRQTLSLCIGYAFKSTKRHPIDPQTVVVGERESAAARFVGYASIDGSDFATFRIGRTFYFQMLISVQIVDLTYTQFTTNDVENGRIYADRSDLIDAPLWWHTRGLSQTATGYGSKLTTSMKVSFNGRLYRVYCTCYSNNGTCWFYADGLRIVLS